MRNGGLIGGTGVLIALSAVAAIAACSAGSSAGHGTGGGGGAFTGVSGGASSGGAGTGGTTVVASGGTTDVASGGASGSGALPHDPSLFAWPEGNPDASAGGTLCKAGHYVGSYSCNVEYADAGINYPLTGPVDLVLQQSQSGEFLAVSGGTLKAATGALAADATVVGQLDCQSGAFSATLQNGTLALVPFPPGDGFGGTLTGTFDANGPEITGSWTLIGRGPFVGYKCKGPWTLTWQAN
jgi:hypothetical protein